MPKSSCVGSLSTAGGGVGLSPGSGVGVLGTLLLQAGVDLKIISSRLGHSNINVTSDIYLHSTKEIDKTACDKMSELLFNSN